MTDYMIRLFSEESDSEKIEEAIESGEKVENDKEVIKPIDEKTAIVEDKENGELTKAELSEGEIELHPISAEEAEKLEDKKEEEPKAEEAPVEEAKAEEEPKAEEEKKEDEKEFSDSPLSKFFAEAGIAAPAAPVAPQAPATAEFIVDENGNPVQPVAAVAEEAAPVLSPEAIEDKALAAVQSIQAAAAEMEAQVLNAKAAPVEGAEQDLQEAHFSEKSEEQKTFSENDTIVSWLGNIKK